MNLNGVIIKNELGGLYGSDKIAEMNEIIGYYDAYNNGIEPKMEQKHYVPTKKKSNIVKKLIKEEARFLFGKTPKFNIKAHKESQQAAAEEIELLLNDILDDNKFPSKIIKGARDCFIGKRIALKLGVTEDKELVLNFVPSLEFVYETDEERLDELKKIIFFYTKKDNEEPQKQVIWKQKYEMINGRCILEEGLYTGTGQLIKMIMEPTDLKLSGIPCYVILNDGLSGDLDGESDVAELLDNQYAYNKLKSEDTDTLIKGMNRTIYTIDIDDTDDLKLGAGYLWALNSDNMDMQGKVGSVPVDFGYDTRIDHATDANKADMYDALNIPQLNSESLKGVIASGKTMEAIYWQLINRCEEKMTDWEPALKWMIKAMIELIQVYKVASIPSLENYKVEIANEYPIKKDKEGEMTLDMQAVNNQVMSRRTYINKWNPDVDYLEELKQIKLEQDLLADDLGGFEQEGDEGDESLDE